VRPPLFAIADGMGGAQAGEVASRLAAAVLRESDGAGAGEARVAELIREANRRVFERANEDATTEGMGTTMTVALVDEGRGALTIGHVGDSRAYRLRSGVLDQLTEDHSLVQELVRSGKLSPEEAGVHPQRAVITRAVGTEPDVDVDTFTVEAEAGDLYLLCSDGLTDMVNEDIVHAAVVAHRGDLDAAARALVAAANRVGGEDNITVVLFELVMDVGDTQAYEPAAGAGLARDDEDTLDELDAVPVVDTAVISAEDVRREVEAAEAASVGSTQTPTGAAAGAETASVGSTQSLSPAADTPKRRRHGAGGGSRWPALIVLVLALGVIAALVVWGLLR
jgi:serine/threonine protein phosphatase PrpC